MSPVLPGLAEALTDLNGAYDPDLVDEARGPVPDVCDQCGGSGRDCDDVDGCAPCDICGGRGYLA